MITPVATNARDTDPIDEQAIALERRRRALSICAADPAASFENVWHALVLLELPPLERLNRSLLRGRAVTVQR
jgi:hypothetical protein